MCMRFFRKNAGILIGMVCLAALAGLLWYWLVFSPGQKEPEGTLVQARYMISEEVPA